MRGMLSLYVLVGSGLTGGFYVGGFLVDYDPQFVAALFGAGAGLSLAAFVAAIATNTPLVGRADAPTHRGVIRPAADPDELAVDLDPDPEPEAGERDAEPVEHDLPVRHARNGNGSGPGY